MSNGIYIEDLVGAEDRAGADHPAGGNADIAAATGSMREVAEAALELHCGYEADVFVSIVDEGEIQQLNSESRGIDRPTDVLSFPYIDFEQGQSLAQAAATAHMLNPETGRLMLGDIVICLDIAKRQADEYGHGLRRELCFLLLHGLLHLLGFDHENDADAERMFGEQDRILSSCGIER